MTNSCRPQRVPIVAVTRAFATIARLRAEAGEIRPRRAVDGLLDDLERAIRGITGPLARRAVIRRDLAEVVFAEQVRLEAVTLQARQHPRSSETL